MSLDSTKFCSNDSIYTLIQMLNSSTLQKAASESCETLKRYKQGMSKAEFRRFIAQYLLTTNEMINEQMQSWPSSHRVQEVRLEQAQGSLSRMIQGQPMQIGSIEAESAHFELASSARLKQEDNLATFSHKKINHEQLIEESQFSQNEVEKSLPSVTFLTKRLNQLNKMSKRIIQRSNKVQYDVKMIQLVDGASFLKIDSSESKEQIIKRLLECISTAENNISAIKKQIGQAGQYYQCISQEISGLFDSQASQQQQFDKIHIQAAENYGKLIIQTLKSNFQATSNKIRQAKKILDNLLQKTSQQKMPLPQNETNPAYCQIPKDHQEFPSLHQKVMKHVQNQPHSQLILGRAERFTQSIKKSAKITQQYAQITAQCAKNIENARRLVEKIAKSSSKNTYEAQDNMKKLTITIKDTQIFLQKSKRYSESAEVTYKQLLVERKNIYANLSPCEYDQTEELLKTEIDAEKAKNIAAENHERACLNAQHVFELAKKAQKNYKRRNFSPNSANLQEKIINQNQKYQKIQKQQQIKQQKHQKNHLFFNRVQGASSPAAKNSRIEEKNQF